jgi:hypothetical protein
MNESQLIKEAKKFDKLGSVDECVQLITTIVERENPDRIKIGYDRLATVMRMCLLRVNDLWLSDVCKDRHTLKAANLDYMRAEIEKSTGPTCFRDAVRTLIHGEARDYMLTSLQIMAMNATFMSCIKRQSEHSAA